MTNRNRTRHYLKILCFSVSALLSSCAGKTYYIPDWKKPVYFQGDTFVFKDINTSLSDSLAVRALVYSFESSDANEYEHVYIWLENISDKDFSARFTTSQRSATIELLNIDRGFFEQYDTIMNSYTLNDRTYTTSFFLKPYKDPINENELEFVQYDFQYGIVKYKYHGGAEFLIDTIISSVLY